MHDSAMACDTVMVQGSSTSTLLSPMLKACESGDLEQVGKFLQDGFDVNLRDAEGWSALIVSAKLGHVDLVRFLLHRGATPNHKDSRHTALRGAAIMGHLECVRVLLDASADPNQCSVGRRTPLMGAAMHGHVLIVALLCERRANIQCENDFCETAASLAKARGHAECALLLEGCHR